MLFFVAKIISGTEINLSGQDIFLLPVSDLKIKTIYNVKNIAEIELKTAQHFLDAEN